LPNLIIQFACGNPENCAEEFQSQLLKKGVLRAGITLENQEDEIWLNLPEIRGHIIDYIVREVREWCLERGLRLVRSKSTKKGVDSTVLLIADLSPPSAV
jgi:hypothetical protein